MIQRRQTTDETWCLPAATFHRLLGNRKNQCQVHSTTPLSQRTQAHCCGGSRSLNALGMQRAIANHQISLHLLSHGSCSTICQQLAPEEVAGAGPVNSALSGAVRISDKSARLCLCQTAGHMQCNGKASQQCADVEKLPASSLLCASIAARLRSHEHHTTALLSDHVCMHCW
jgi:hypothetical protein